MPSTNPETVPRLAADSNLLGQLRRGSVLFTQESYTKVGLLCEHSSYWKTCVVRKGCLADCGIQVPTLGSFLLRSKFCWGPLTHFCECGKLWEKWIWGLGKVEGVTWHVSVAAGAEAKAKDSASTSHPWASKQHCMVLCSGQKGPYTRVSFASILCVSFGGGSVVSSVITKKTWRGRCLRRRHPGQIWVNTDYRWHRDRESQGIQDIISESSYGKNSRHLNPPMIPVSISIDFNAGAILSKC